MAEDTERDRRFRGWDSSVAPGTRPCRICMRIVTLDPAQIERTYLHVYARCPECEVSFPIRHSDVALVAGQETLVS